MNELNYTEAAVDKMQWTRIDIHAILQKNTNFNNIPYYKLE